jgi:recombinational DNA repair ATPase RecF
VDEPLKHIVYGRLRDADLLKQPWSSLVIGACEGAEYLAQSLGRSAAPATALPEIPPAETHPVRAFLTDITVQGFRGIGAEASLELTPGPGLTLVVGRNGSGKSSFAEGLEVLLTGDSGRWSGRAKVWKEGWRNLHHPHPAFIEAELARENGAPTRVTRTWAQDADVDSGTVTVQEHGKPKAGLDSLGWGAALSNYRPFLSYNELGSMLDEGPSKLYDALSVVLGLEDLVQAQGVLADERLARKKALDRAKDVANELIRRATELQATGDDERVGRALELLSAKTWDADALEELAMGAAGAPDDSVVEVLRRACALEAPARDAVEAVTRDLRAAATAREELRGTDAARAFEVAGLLEKALAYHEGHDSETCPVCGTENVIDESWRDRTHSEVERLRAEARRAEEAVTELARATEAARRLLTPAPRALEDAGTAGVDVGDAMSAWTRWSEAPSVTDPEALATHLESEIEVLGDAVAEVRKKAHTELRRREDRWLPLATEVAGWVGPARDAQADAAHITDLQKAERWLKDAAGAIRDERFAPIAAKATAMWKQLRQQSNVELGAVTLAGSGPARKVTLEVTVDGVEGAALGVMSQGELNSLALSLFLPRATMDESPFGFIVIDDPVQSMDPSRVDGLARVLEDAAKTHQVVVFTHDDRLPESTRRLGIEARIIEVHRRANSVIELRKSQHPVTTYIEDALALAQTDELPSDVARQVVPGFCRSAIEAACIEVVRRRRLRKGEGHAQVEAMLAIHSKLRDLLALVLFNDAQRRGEVVNRLGNDFGPRAAQTFSALNKAVHDGYHGTLKDLARDSESLANNILGMKS